MKTIRRTLRPFLAAALFLALLVPLPAENWQAVTIDVAPVRAGHAFALGANSTGDPASFFESGGYAATRLLASLDLDQPITLFDWTAGDSLTLDFSAGTALDARGALWNAGPGLPRQYFLLPWTLASHEFALIHPDGTTYPLTKGNAPSLTTAYGSAFEASALCTSGQEFWLADLQTYTRSPSWETYLVSASWTNDPTLRPLEPVTLYLEGREDGHYFTIHCFAARGPVTLQSLQAVGGSNAAAPAPGGGWLGTFEVYAGSATLSFTMGRGMEFWVTRDADQQPTESPHWTADNSVVAPQVWPLYGIYPAIPPPPPEPQTFRIHARRWGNLFTVWQSDGIHYPFAATMESGWPGQLYTGGNITEWNGQSVLNPLQILTFAVSVDPTRAWWLRDDTTGEAFPIAQTDVLDSWRPVTPGQSVIGLLLRYPNGNNGPFQLFAPEVSPGAGETPLGQPFWASDYYAGYTLDTMAGLDGMASYTIGTEHFAIPKPEATGNGPYLLYGGSTPVPVDAGDNDLRFGPPQALQLMISTSRWYHELILRHPDGTAYPVVRHSTQGNISFSTTGNAWMNSYYYFDATTTRIGEMPWYLEDASTGERLGPFQSPDESFINWVATADPKNLTATENANGTFQLTWNFYETSTEGAFRLQRRESDSAPWVSVTIPAAGNLDTTAHLAVAPTALPASQSGLTAKVRVFYTYGGLVSAPSNIVALQRNLDSDSDGMADWWERYHFGGLNTPGGGAGESWARDTWSNRYKYEHGMNPTTVSGTTTTEPPGGSAVKLQVFTRLES